jgi:hypothetical protein
MPQYVGSPGGRPALEAVTPAMIDAGTSILYNEPLAFPCGVDFDARDLVARIFLAMEWHRPSKLPALELSEDCILAQLRPLERWQYLAKHNRGEFILWILALVGGAIMLIVAGVHLGLSIFSSAVAGV